MGARHQLNGQSDVKEVVVEHLFLMMGSTLKLIDQAPAGSIVGIGGLDEILFKTGTISSTPMCPNFTKQQAISMGLVKVTIETELDGMDFLKTGLIKLNKADPSVQFYINNKGEFILSTCGEIHLERCIKDLNDDFCPGIPITLSEPIIPFRETILNKKLTNRILVNKKENYEEIDSDSDSEEEKKDKDRQEMTVAELIAFEEKMEGINEQLKFEKELLKKEQQLDPYMEKLLEMKLLQKDEKLLQKANLNRGWAQEATSNKLVQVKIRAVGLDFEIVKWIEKNLRGLRDSFELSQ